MQPTHLNGATDDYTLEDIAWIASQFQIPGPVSASPFQGKGNINLHTYEVSAGGKAYLLQKVNSTVFTMPHRVMNAMLASIECQANSVAAGIGDPDWVPIELISTREGKPYLDMSDSHGLSVWRLMVKIPNSISYKSLSELPIREDQLALAEEIGRGIAVYSSLTAGIDPGSIDGSLPGYRVMRIYYGQLHSVLARNRRLADVTNLPADPIVRSSTEQHFLLALDDEAHENRLSAEGVAKYLQVALDAEPDALVLWNALETGTIPYTLIHGDTKIENFLFCSQTGKVKSLVDLDTIMPFTWLGDWGDLLRSMVNVAGEKESDLSKIVVDKEIYASVAKGFLGSDKELTPNEAALLTRAVEALTLEIGVRFLTDYLRGDTYFRLSADDPADLNRIRGLVQLTLYERLVEFRQEAEAILARHAK